MSKRKKLVPITKLKPNSEFNLTREVLGLDEAGNPYTYEGAAPCWEKENTVRVANRFGDFVIPDDTMVLPV